MRPGVSALVVAGLLGVATPPLPSASAGDASASTTERITRCSRGLVALTFDDGPREPTTRKTVKVLVRRKAPATFFVVGEMVPGHGRLLRRMHRHGLRIGNHTYHHENLTRLSSRKVRRTLRHTNHVIRRTGLHRPRLMRPPYGAINDRVRRIARDLHLTPVLWDIDSRDWDGRSTRGIVAKVMAGLDPGRNIVLLHDGVANSDRTLSALPVLIKRIRRHGYCLAPLGRHGVPRPPVPTVRVLGDTVRERGRHHPVYLRFHVRLSKATSRPVSVRVDTRARTAMARRDFAPRAFRLRFPVGKTHRVVRVKVYGDARRERVERLRLVLTHRHGLRFADRSAHGTIRASDR